ncbi:MAG: Alcohol dehydrogenase zinc-binding domain protein [Frankiales bacterium]|nr:Alcohol dehydrogenase zinc-binding domain protein [Frankiales bacterium]
MTTHQAESTAASAATMRAVVRDRYGAPADVLRVGQVAAPEIGSGELLVEVRAAGVDRGVWHVVTGLPYPIRLAGFGVRTPTDPVVGGDLAGVVRAVGSGVTRFRIGDEVYGTGHGTYAELARAAEDKLSAKPTTLTFEQAAAVPVSATTALQAVRDHGKVQPGQQVLVIGASGGVGSYAVQIAKSYGAVVTGVASGAKLDLVRSLGADHVIDYATGDHARCDYDVILDVGGNTPVARLRKTLSRTGTLVIIGGETAGRILGGVQRQLGASLLSPFVRQRLGTFVCKENATDLAVLTGLIDAGRVTPAVDRVLPLSSANEALQLLLEGSVRGKLVLTVSSAGADRDS